MTISKGANLTITTGGASESMAAFSSSQAGVTYNKPGSGATASGFLLDISGITVTKAGAQADLQTASTGGFQRLMICPSSSAKLLMLGVDDNITNAEVTIAAITKTATELVGGTPNVLTFPGNADNDFINAIYPWDGDGLVVIHKVGSPVTFYLTIANDSSQGNVVEFSPSPAPFGNIPTFAQLNATSGILIYKESSTNDFMGVKLTRTGTTLSAGTPFTIDTDNPAAGSDNLAACIVDNSGRIAVGYIDTSFDKNIRTMDDTVDNTPLVIVSGDATCWLERFHAGSIIMYAATGVICDWEEYTIAAGGGLTAINTVAGSGNGNTARGAMSRLDNSHIIAVFSGAGTMLVAILTTDVPPPGISDSEFTSGLLTAKPADIDMDGLFIYIGAIASDSTPILIKFSTALNADGSIVFQPGSGDNIGVEVGKKDADVVWVAGNFGATDTVEKSEDAGASFVVKDDGTFDPATSFAVGPDSDERVLIFTDAGGSVASSEIHETIDDGDSWELRNSGLGFVSRATERLDINVQELVTGNEAAASDNIDYSPNTGEDLEDYSSGFPQADVTKLIVG